MSPFLSSPLLLIWFTFFDFSPALFTFLFYFICGSYPPCYCYCSRFISLTPPFPGLSGSAVKLTADLFRYLFCYP